MRRLFARSRKQSVIRKLLAAFTIAAIAGGLSFLGYWMAVTGRLDWADVRPWLLDTGVWIAATVVLGALALVVFEKGIVRILPILTRIVQPQVLRQAVEIRLQGITRAFCYAGRLVILGVVLVITLALVGVDLSPAVDVLESVGRGIQDYAVPIGIAIAIVIGFVLNRVINKYIPAVVKWTTEIVRPQELRTILVERQEAIGSVLTHLSPILIASILLLFILPHLGISIAPVLAYLSGATAWILAHGVRVGIVLGLGYLAIRMSRRYIPWMVGALLVKPRGRGRRAQEELEKRSATLGGVFSATVTVMVFGIAGYMILAEAGIDVAPLLAGAGILGIAIGFGGQSLVKDVLAGTIILMEDQFAQGDVVKIAGVIGLVEGVGLRKTTLRDLDGIVHFVPNGQIDVASNYTKDWSRINLDVPVAYGENMDNVIAVLNRVGSELAEDGYLGPLINDPPKVLGVNKFADSGIEIKVLGETKPIRQWEVGRELRKRIKETFDQEGIEIPWPHTKVFFGGGLALSDQEKLAHSIHQTVEQEQVTSLVEAAPDSEASTGIALTTEIVQPGGPGMSRYQRKKVLSAYDEKIESAFPAILEKERYVTAALVEQYTGIVAEEAAKRLKSLAKKHSWTTREDKRNPGVVRYAPQRKRKSRRRHGTPIGEE